MDNKIVFVVCGIFFNSPIISYPFFHFLADASIVEAKTSGNLTERLQFLEIL